MTTTILLAVNASAVWCLWTFYSAFPTAILDGDTHAAAISAASFLWMAGATFIAELHAED